MFSAIEKYTGLFAQYTSSIVVAAISALLTILIAKSLGPSDFGVYSFALSLGAIALVLFDFGNKHLIQREVASSSLSLEVSTIQFTALAHGLFCFFGLAIVAYILMDNFVVTILTLSCFLAISISQQVSGLLRGKQLHWWDAGHQISGRALSAAFIGVALFLSPSVSSVIFAWSVGLFAWLLILATYSSPKIPKSISLTPYKHLASLFIVDLLIVLHLRLDVMLLGVFNVPDDYMGQYSAALRVIELVLFFTLPIKAVLLTKLRLEGFRGKQQRFLVRVAVAAIAGGFASIILSLMSSHVIGLIFGSQYDEAAKILSVMSWIFVPAFSLLIIVESCLAFGLEKIYQRAMIRVVLCNVVSGLLLLSLFSYEKLAAQKVVIEWLLAAASFGLLFRALQGIRNSKAI